MIDLEQTISYTGPGMREPRTVRVKIRRSVLRDTGQRLITVRGLPALFAARVESVTDPERRLTLIERLVDGHIGISDQPLSDPHVQVPATQSADRMVETSYRGHPDLPVSEVIETAVRLRDQFARQDEDVDGATR
ncbi:hypothetical protein [Streptomyces sp. NPDC048606]|uniref:hypothetical protein n=1 Tax=Streptomyces sp. NPDC048606 TaxID=3154726 RepID=UPI003420563C